MKNFGFLAGLVLVAGAQASELEKINSLINRGDPSPMLSFNSAGQLVQDPRVAAWKISGANDGKDAAAQYEALSLRVLADAKTPTTLHATMKSDPKSFDALLGWDATLEKGVLTSVTQCFTDQQCVTATASRCEDAKEMAGVKNARELMQFLRKCDKVVSASLPSASPEFDAAAQRSREVIASLIKPAGKLEEAKVTSTQFLIGMGDACDVLGSPTAPGANPGVPAQHKP